MGMETMHLVQTPHTTDLMSLSDSALEAFFASDGLTVEVVPAGLTVEVIPEVLAAREASVTRTERLNETGALFRSIRPHLNAVPASFQPLLQDPEPLSGPLWYVSRLPMVTWHLSQGVGGGLCCSETLRSSDHSPPLPPRASIIGDDAGGRWA